MSSSEVVSYLIVSPSAPCRVIGGGGRPLLVLDRSSVRSPPPFSTYSPIACPLCSSHCLLLVLPPLLLVRLREKRFQPTNAMHARGGVEFNRREGSRSPGVWASLKEKGEGPACPLLLCYPPYPPGGGRRPKTPNSLVNNRSFPTHHLRC